MSAGLTDLHTHTNASDGTDTPEQLLRRAHAGGVRTLAITDHDTLEGVDSVLALAPEVGLELIRGIELSTRVEGESDPTRRNAHLLGYFFEEPGPVFRDWLMGLRGKRRERNGAIAARLRTLGIDVHLEEAEALGKSVTGRPHFAELLAAKGYVTDERAAFDIYLGENGSAYVEREDPPVSTAIRYVQAGGGVTSIAHPIRLNQPYLAHEDEIFERWTAAGLDAVEVWHSDQSEADERRYTDLAACCGLLRTGGSDFHGNHSPGVLPGIGKGRLRVPASVLDDLRGLAAGRSQVHALQALNTQVAQSPDGLLSR